MRERDGERLVTDGPFAETKEQLGGYYLIDVPDLDAALEWASKMPNIARGSVEVRPVRSSTDAAAGAAGRRDEQSRARSRPSATRVRACSRR